MKFYFCEACGKRLTEEDISAGVAKDKQLKGVYCRGCAVGVTTLDTIPLTEGQARALIATEKTEETTNDPVRGEAQRRRRATTASALPTRRAPSARRESSIPEVGKRRRDRSTVNIALAGVGFALLLVIGLALFAGGKNEPPKRTAKRSQPKTTPQPSTDPSTNGPVTSPHGTDTEPTPVAKTPMPPEKETSTPAISEHQPSSPVTEPETPATPPDPNPGRNTAAEEKKEPDKVEATTTPTPDPPPPAAPSDAASATDPKAYWEFTKAYLTLLAQRQIDAARTKHRATLNDKKLEGHKQDLQRATLALAWTAELEKAYREGLRKLPGVERIELQRKTGQRFTVGKNEAMKVLEVHADRLVIGQAGMSMPLALDALAPGTRDGIMKLAWQGTKNEVLEAFHDLIDILINDDRDPGRRKALAGKMRALAARSPGEASGYLTEQLALLNEHLPVVEKTAKPNGQPGEDTDSSGGQPSSMSLALKKGLRIHKTFDKVAAPERKPTGSKVEADSEEGVFGRAIRFKGQIMRMGGTGNTKQASISLWVKRAAHERDMCVFEYRYRYRLQLQLAHAVWRWQQNKNRYSLKVPLPVRGPATDWIHLAWTCDGARAVAYVNGRPMNAAAAGGGDIGPGNDGGYTMRIGGRFTTSGMKNPTFDGWLDEFRIYDRALDAKAIEALAKRPGKPK